MAMRDEVDTGEGAATRVLLADDHTMFRQGIREMLSTDESIEVVGEAENGAEAVEFAGRLEPDVVLIDVEMPVMGAREAIPRLVASSPKPKIVVVTMFDDPRLVRELLGLGADGFLVKSASLKELLAAVHTVMDDADEDPGSAGGPREENAVLVLPRGSLDKVQRGDKDFLSAREREILLLVARGLSNRQIATSLRLAEATVKRHLANLYPKLGVSSRVEAIKKALSEGYISPHDVTR